MDDYMEIVAAINNALYIGKYLINHDKKYKKDKKRILQMLDDTENGKFVDYVENPLDCEEYNEWQ